MKAYKALASCLVLVSSGSITAPHRGNAQTTGDQGLLNGKQHVVICAGGHGKLGTKQGDFVIAFTLP